MKRPTRRRKNLSSLFLDGTAAVKVTERSSPRKIHHEYDIPDLDNDGV